MNDEEYRRLHREIDDFLDGITFYKTLDYVLLRAGLCLLALGVALWVWLRL